MDAELIEYWDRRRYRTMVWGTIGFVLLAGLMITEEIVEITGVELPGGVTLPLSLLILAGFVITLAAAITNGSNKRQIKKVPALKEALDNELVRLYNYKSLKTGACIAFFSVWTIFVVEPWFPMLTVKLTCLIIMFLGCLGAMISLLAYMRR